MQRKFILPLLILTSFPGYAQVKDSAQIKQASLDEFIISASKFPERRKNIAQLIHIINRKEIEWAMPQTTAVLLEQTGNVFVQKSQLGGGSPVLRGFEASRVLLMIDGVRMNNAIYRAGHLQNVITVDNNILDRVEVLHGPASTLFGSDALGGVILFSTKQPQLSLSKKLKLGVNAMSRYSSAYNEFSEHIDFNIGLKKVAFMSSISYSKFGDLRQGSFRSPLLEGFGSREEYVASINGADSIVKNSDPNVQKFSGYTQWDLVEKILFRQSDRVSHTLNLQYSNSSDIPRYDRLTDVSDGKLRYAEWYYGPQERLMAAYQFHALHLNGWFDEVKTGLNYQAIEESRHQRDRGKSVRQSRTEHVNVIGFNTDAKKSSDRHEFMLGLDGQYNKVNSEAHSRHIETGDEVPLDTRYPDGGSSMFYGAVYGQHIFKIIPDKLVLNDGIRLNYVSLKAKFDDKTFFPFPYDEAKQNYLAWSGNLGLVYMPGKRWRIALNGSTGFRAPNVDDVAKVFESAGGEQLVVPNPGLKPEYTYNADLGLSYQADNSLKLEATAFYTSFRDAIVMYAFTLDGADSVLYDGQVTRVVANQNKAHAYLYGFNAAITAMLIPDVTLYSTINYTFGRYIDQDDNEIPLDHMPPVFGKTSISYRPGKFNGEVFALYNGWKYLSQYNPDGEDNQQYATAYGMPAWFTLNARAGYAINKYVAVEAALENVLDYNYRVFASGISAPGRNFVLTVRGRF